MTDVEQGPDVTWAVFADPEGNDFSVLRPLLCGAVLVLQALLAWSNVWREEMYGDPVS
jgi:hypothetical protein